MTPKAREEAADMLLAAADWWDFTIAHRSADGAKDAIGPISAQAGRVVNSVVSALKRSGVVVADNMWWPEAAALLLDGWNPGDEIVMRVNRRRRGRS